MNIRIGFQAPELPDLALRATLGALGQFDCHRNAALLAQVIRQAGSAVQGRT